jgi:uncharacterized protein
VNSSSPYLRQHAHNPVFWYPWGREPIERARLENKPIFLSIGYSTCYWCHVMEREVFQNLSIASQLNRNFINIKVDREERPDIDELYMVARQVMTHEGGWPNNVFLTPQLKPFHAGGTYAADESYGRMAFPRLLEWLHFVWTTQEGDARKVADDVTEAMKPHIIFSPPASSEKPNVNMLARKLFGMLKNFHDGRSGGFYQAPKFPHECLLSFLLGYYEHTNAREYDFAANVDALDMVTTTLRKMAAGGIYDHVGCGFHRYAVDKEWYVPHFEKMLYNQAMLARIYTDAARFSGSEYFADIAKSVLDMVHGPFTDGTGAFYSAFDAEVDEIEGSYYAWTASDLEQILAEDENAFFTTFYALADIPTFPGHKETEGQVIIARNPLDEAARANNITYLQLAAMTGQVMNKLLQVRNVRKAPALDNKILVGWNGLMIDAYAHAGRVFNKPNYLLYARKAADFLLEHAINNEGMLGRVYIDGEPQIFATLEDHAYLMKGLLTLWRATPDDVLLEAAQNLGATVDELFSDGDTAGYCYSQPSEFLLVRAKNPDDMTLPNANAVMVHNFIDLFDITGDDSYRAKAQAMLDYFLAGRNDVTPELATLLHAGIRLDALVNGKTLDKPEVFDTSTRVDSGRSAAEEAVTASVALSPEDPAPGSECALRITLNIKNGWHINAERVYQPFLVPTQVGIQGKDMELLDVKFPKPRRIETGDKDKPLLVFEGLVTINARVKLAPPELGMRRAPFKVLLRFQPCTATACDRTQDIVIAV